MCIPVSQFAAVGRRISLARFDHWLCHSTYRVYDPYHNDYHRWDNHETVYYHQWVVENHRDDRDFRKLNKDEQKRYWDWRHEHHDYHGEGTTGTRDVVTRH